MFNMSKAEKKSTHTKNNILILKSIPFYLSVHFNARHCFDLGIRALETEFYKLAYAWLNEALKRSSSDSSVDTLDIELAIAHTKFRLGDIKGANQTYSELSSLHPESEKVAKVFADFSHNSIGKPEWTVDYTIEHNVSQNNY